MRTNYGDHPLGLQLGPSMSICRKSGGQLNVHQDENVLIYCHTQLDYGISFGSNGMLKILPAYKSDCPASKTSTDHTWRKEDLTC